MRMKLFETIQLPLNLFKLAVNSINLEGIYFYAGFAFFYNLARQAKNVKDEHDDQLYST